MAKASSKTAILAALIGNSLIAVTKFTAAALTGSSAMLSEGIHSLVDTGNQVLLLWGLRQAKRPADDYFPFGHGKEIYFWSFVVAILLFAIGSGVSMWEGLHHLRAPREISRPIINYIVLGAAIVFEAFSFYIAFREFNKARDSRGYFEAVRHGKDPALLVVLFEDAAAMAGLLVALAGVALSHITGNPIFDGAASAVIGAILGITAIWLAYETKGLLIGEAAEPVVVQGIRDILLRYPAVERVNEVLTLHMGPEFILLNVSVDFADDIPVGELEKTIAEISGKIKNAFPRVQRVFIEAERRGGELESAASLDA